MFRSWGAIGSPIFAESEGGRGQNGTFLGDFTWNDPFVNLVTIGSLFTYQILTKLVNQILRYGGGGGASAHVQRCPIPPMTCGKHVLSDPQPTYQI